MSTDSTGSRYSSGSRYFSSDPYAVCNRWLFPRVENYRAWSSHAFDEVIARLNSLPHPNTPAEIQRLKRSRLGETLANLARRLAVRGTQSETPDKAAPTQEPEKRLTALWNACRPIAACFEMTGYVSFLRVALEINADASLVKDICSTAEMHGIDSTPVYIEKYLALKARHLVDERDKEQLEALFDRAEALDIYFLTFNWGVLAGTAGKLQAGEMLEIVWERSGASHASFDEATWRQFSNAAGLVHQNGVLGRIWDEWTVLGDLSVSSVWSSFANAVARKHDAELLEKFWQASQPYRREIDSSVWGAFAKAAGNVDQQDLLWEIWTGAQETSVQLNSQALGSFAIAAGEVAHGELLEAVWKELQVSGRQLDAPGWGALAKSSLGVKRADLLREIFDAWQPQPDTLSKAEHAIWGSFFAAAFGLGDEELAIEIFRRLAAAADPVRLRNWGTLTAPLLSYAVQLKRPDLAAEITETLAGFRLDTSRCFNILATIEPGPELSGVGDRPFEGAARCLMKWLVNSYFYSSNDEFDRRLAHLVGNLSAIKQNQLRVWHALMCRGQEAYVACLRNLYGWRYKQYFSYIDGLSDEELRDQIVAGRIEELLAEFGQVLKKITAPQGTVSLSPAAPVMRLEPLVKVLESNQQELLRGRKVGDKIVFFTQALELLEAADIETFTENDWSEFLRFLLQKVSSSIWSVLVENSVARLHDLKNDFQNRLMPKLADETISDVERARLIRAARVLLLNYGQLVGRYRYGVSKAINIIPAVRPILLGGGRNLHPQTTVDLPSAFTINAWDGARDDLLAPLLRELRFNADRNLRVLPDDEQVYQVTLKPGEGVAADYAILTVSNAYRDGGPKGSGQGIGLVQRFADALGGFALHDKSALNDDLMMWTWHVYLPLFKEVKSK